jgi:hypothetical protein
MVSAYQYTRRHPGNLGCASCSDKYSLRGHPALRGVGHLSAVGDATGAGLPAGTVLAYTASWPDTKFQLKTPNAVQSQIQSILAQQWGIVIDSQYHSQSDYFNFSGTQTMTLQVHTMSDYGAAQDVQKIIDGAIYNATQAMPQSTIRVVSQAVVSPVSPTAQLPANTSAAIAAANAGYQDAIARGDQTSASQFAAQLQTLQNPGSPTSWLSSNWPLLALGLGAVVVAREVL